MRVSKMIELKFIPKSYESTKPELSEEDAKTIWSKLVKMHPEVEVVEDIPINEFDVSNTSHAPLIRKTAIYNNYCKQVVQAAAAHA